MEPVAVRYGKLWRWKIVQRSGVTFEESTTAYPTREAALDAARQRAQIVMLGRMTLRDGVVSRWKSERPDAR